MNQMIRMALLPAAGLVLIVFSFYQGALTGNGVNAVFLIGMLALIAATWALSLRRMFAAEKELTVIADSLQEGRPYTEFVQTTLHRNAGLDADALKAQNSRYLAQMQAHAFSDPSVNEDWHRLLQDWKASGGRTCDAADYVNEAEILENCHDGICAQMPGILTAMGILGTFIGLVIGLGQFDFSNSERMVSSVEALVGGLNVAFYTSIYGVTLSIIFNIVYRNILSGVRMRLNRFYDVFDTVLVPVSDADAQSAIQSSLDRQTASMDRITTLLDQDMGRALGEQIAKQMIPEFDRIDLSLRTVILDFQEKQANALEDIVKAFVGQMSSSLDSHIDTLGVSVDRLSGAQAEMTQDLRTLITEIAQTGRSTSDINDKADNIVRNLENYIHNLEETTARSVEVIGQMQSYAASMQESLARQEETLAVLNRHEASLDETCRQISASQDEFGTNLRAFSSAATQLAGRELDPLQMQDIKSMLESYMTQTMLQQKNYADRLDQERGQTFEHSAAVFETANKVLLSDLKTQSEHTEVFMQNLVREMKESLDKMEKAQQEIIYFSGLTASRLDPENKDIRERISKPSFLGNKKDPKDEAILQLVKKMDSFMERQEEMQTQILAIQERQSRSFFGKLADLFKH